jgi:hypothetical protein
MIHVPGNPERFVMFAGAGPRNSGLRTRNVAVVAIVNSPEGEPRSYYADYTRVISHARLSREPCIPALSRQSRSEYELRFLPQRAPVP